MASGVKVHDDVKEKYKQCCISSCKSKKLRFLTCCFAENLKTIIVENCGEEKDYCELISELPEDDVRYVIYDFEYINKDGCRKSDIIFISWHPERCSIRKKMICASSLNAIKSSLSISKNVMEADNRNELNIEAVLEKIGGKAVPT